jgi:uncharacterized repeat protein (TIGR03806 family)
LNRSTTTAACAALLLSACLAPGLGPTPEVDRTPPSVPQDVAAVAASPTRVSVSWAASTDTGTGVAGYQVRRGGAPVATVDAPTTSYEDASVSASTAYAYTVRAFDRAVPPNFSDDSTTANVTTPTPGGTPGLDARPANSGPLACLGPARPTPPGPAQLDDVYPSLPGFNQPILALQAPGDPSRWFVVERSGVVQAFANQASVSSSTEFLDISARVDSESFQEMGLLGMAFHPAWPGVAEVFVSYTASGPRRSVISRFTASPGNQRLDPASEQVILTVDQPDLNHNGGNIAFGPDGYLYVGLGDGGGGGDTYGNSQKLTTMLAKILRIDVQGTGAGYAIPADNPYAGNAQCGPGANAAPCPEIYAFGFRNPWRWSFDRGGSHDLWVADVGQDAWEEAGRVEKGFNYGWNLREGTHCYRPSSGCPLPGSVQAGAILVDPETDYPHAAGGGNSTTGGFVYRGTALPALIGLYVWGDFGSGTVWTHEPGLPGNRTVLLQAGFALSSFAEGVDGELYAIDYGAGRLNRFVPSGSPGVDTVASDLAVACPSAVSPDGAGSVLIPYRLNAPFWSDGAVKDRWMALPDGATVTVDATSGDWDFPVGSVLVKQFRVGGKRVETRLLMRHTDGTWAGYTYEWNDAETAATRVRGGKTGDLGAQTWLYPSEQQCLQCHTQAAGRSLGLETAQQNGDLTYPATGRTANQLVTLQAIGVITGPGLPDPPGTYPALPDPFGTAGTLELRARAYLHSNCSQCHRPGGPAPTALDFRSGTALAATHACDVNPSAGDLGVANARIIAPGAPASSILLERMKRLDAHRMPPVGSLVVDQAGVTLVTAWIQSLTGCN